MYILLTRTFCSNFNQAPKPYPGSICVLPCKIQFYQECSYVSITRSESVSHSVTSDSLWPHELYSPPGSSVHGIFQARILEWVAIPFSRGSSQPRDRTQVSHIAGRFFTVWATREAPNPLPFSDEHAAAPNCSKMRNSSSRTKSWKHFFRIPRKLSFSFTYYENKHSISYNCTIKKEWYFTAFVPFITDPCKSLPVELFLQVRNGITKK